MVNVEDDATAGDTKDIACLLICFAPYTQLLIYITSLTQPTICRLLESVVLSYSDRVATYRLGRLRFEDVRALHFSFHKKRATLGIDDPAGWEAAERKLIAKQLGELYVRELNGR